MDGERLLSLIVFVLVGGMTVIVTFAGIAESESAFGAGVFAAFSAVATASAIFITTRRE